ncbi:3-oxoacyl-ACP synthase III family protein, partial [Streptomyces lydicus]
MSIAINKNRDNVAMLGIGAYRPERIVSNADVCEVLDSNPEWIYDRTGIRNRRWISGDETLRSIAAAAGERALVNSGIDRSKIGALILATSSWLMLTPHGAPSIAHDLGINGIPAFDLTSGCGGFGYGLGVAADLIRAGSADYVLLIGAETMTVGLDPTDRGTAMIFGDGAGAVVLGPSASGGLRRFGLHTFGDLTSLIRVPAGGSRQPYDPAAHELGAQYFTMDGRGVRAFVNGSLPVLVKQFLHDSGVAPDDITHLIP